MKWKQGEVKVRNVFEGDANKLDTMREKVDTKMQLIIREQEQVIQAADKGIDVLNSDLKALQRRLQKYTNQNAVFDALYYDLTDRYANKLSERATLERARNMAEESITAAKLHVIPGETKTIDREV
jgi:Skp family chaperone for outer membrane proteins